MKANSFRGLMSNRLPPRRLWDEFASVAPEAVLFGGTAHLGLRIRQFRFFRRSARH
jgi:hypothetical protein